MGSRTGEPLLDERKRLAVDRVVRTCGRYAIIDQGTGDGIEWFESHYALD